MEPAKIIRRLREERFVKAIEIERISRSIAEAKKNPDFYVSHATLADVESGSIPSIYKIFSLAVCLKIPYEQVLVIFGVDPQQVIEYREPEDRKKTELEPFNMRQSGSRFTLHFDNRVDLKQTSLLEPGVDELALIPASLRQQMDPSRFRYAIVGLDDDSMDDIIPGGSLVEIDREQCKIEVFAWKSLRERPVYFVLHELGYSCCWCQQDGNVLMLLPHPASRQPVRRYKTPTHASVIGRVVHAWLQLGPTMADQKG